MSDNKKTTEAVAPETDATEVTTLNTHATSEPLDTSKLKADEGTGDATTDNTHATGEPTG
ncbi:hypothetical protein J7F01_21870 [Streptomyces sp. ISL-22]|uniref:Uncharacterized protein n=1 Tax=Streptomyces curacoi TaxID=146536 RepID=A0A124GYX1_9ACTN|nr:MULTISPECIES: hypothetical protein [Streptomyces]KUM72455.1 hypothetical protein AQI70_24525 [Streptomyces curacoi]MBT2420813.1 hypothetical protein [Streptomyces sp. ISL-24]MBT2434767.1 hypothetical protein [Streptomyces sp. ISL-22]